MRCDLLIDGGDTVRALVTELPPCAGHILDWFHVTMRLTVLGQFVKGYYILNYGERISTAFVESTVNVVFDKRLDAPASIRFAAVSSSQPNPRKVRENHSFGERSAALYTL